MEHNTAPVTCRSHSIEAIAQRFPECTETKEADFPHHRMLSREEISDFKSRWKMSALDRSTEDRRAV